MIEPAIDPAVALRRLLSVLERRQVLTREDVAEVTQPAKRQLPEAERVALIRSLRGKYKDALSSSEEFMRRKHAELDADEDA
jgi:hypothetical protein